MLPTYNLIGLTVRRGEVLRDEIAVVNGEADTEIGILLSFSRCCHRNTKEERCKKESGQMHLG